MLSQTSTGVNPFDAPEMRPTRRPHRPKLGDACERAQAGAQAPSDVPCNASAVRAHLMLSFSRPLYCLSTCPPSSTPPHPQVSSPRPDHHDLGDALLTPRPTPNGDGEQSE